MVVTDSHQQFSVARLVRYRSVAHRNGCSRLAAYHCTVMPSYGRRAKVVGGQSASIASYIELPFEVAGVKRDIRVAVIPMTK